MCATLVAALLLAAAPSTAKEPSQVMIVTCAPGYPGTTAEAQPTMDLFAKAVAGAAGLPAGAVGAVYSPTEKDGLARIAAPEVAAALVTLPFLLKHEEALKLEPRLQVETRDSGAGEVWTLVAKKGRVSKPASLEGFTVYSIAGYAPGFVRGALGGWGRIPESAKVVESSQVLSSLRKAVGGAEVAVLLDGTQGAALSSLPFAAELEVVARSEKLPSAFLAEVGGRLSPALEKGFEKLPGDPQGATVLSTLRMTRFVPVDPAQLAAARRVVAGPAK
ncbi:MAG: hypothetical protein ACYC8T_09100 [Myxococcaceae bacterium]